MSEEYAAVIEVWFKADGQEEADGIAGRLAGLVLEDATVTLVECQGAESTE